MTPTEIKARPAAAASTKPDTDSICFWLQEIAWQLAVMNERNCELTDPDKWHEGDSEEAWRRSGV